MTVAGTVAVIHADGREILVDAADLPALCAHRWYINEDGYARGHMRALFRGENKRRMFMHRYLINAPSGLEVDHINGNRLDNRRANLRLATRQANAWNRTVVRSNCGHLNIHRRRTDGRFQVAFRRKFLGVHDSLSAAIAARDAEYIRLGEQAPTP